MTISQALLSFAAVAVLMTVIPGLDTALVLRSAIRQGRTYAYATAIGIGTGAMAWGIAAAVGVSALLTASALAYQVVKIAGALYMVWLGISLLRASFRTHPASFTDQGDTRPPSLLGAWSKGVITNLLNPKVGVFYIAMIPQFIPADTSPLMMGVLLAGVNNLLGLAWFTLIIFGTQLARRWLQTARVARITDRITGTVLIGFGLKLGLDARH